MADEGAVVGVDSKYEFCAPHFFDFSYQESCEDVKLVESWFETAFGHEASPQVVRGSAFSTLQSKCPKKYVEHENERQQLRFSGTLNSVNTVACEPNGFVSTSYVIEVSGHGLLDQDKDNVSRVLSSSTIVDKEKVEMRIPKGSDRSFCAEDASAHGQVGPHNVVKVVESSKNVPVTKKPKRQIHKPNENGAMIKKQKVEGVLTRQAKELGSPFISMAEKVQKFQTGTTRELRSLCRENGVPIPSRKQKLTLTKPKEPELVTSYRIRASRVKSSAQLEEEMLSKIPKFKARPVNKKILDGPTLLTLPKKAPQMPEFEVFHLRTMERALRHTEYAGQPSTIRTQSKLCTISTQRGKHTQIASSKGIFNHHLPTSKAEDSKGLEEKKLDKYPKCMMPQRSGKTLKPMKQPIPEELWSKENVPTRFEEHSDFTKSKTMDNENPLRVLRTRKPLGSIEASVLNRQGGNQQCFTRMALKKQAADMIIKETEYTIKDSLYQKRTTRLQTLKQEISTQRFKVESGLQVSSKRGCLKRKSSGHAEEATSKKLQFR